jgi:hypothetical protein
MPAHQKLLMEKAHKKHLCDKDQWGGRAEVVWKVQCNPDSQFYDFSSNPTENVKLLNQDHNPGKDMKNTFEEDFSMRK